MGAAETDGTVLLLRAEDLVILAEHRDTRLPVNALRFDPSGRFVACGSRDYKVYVYEIVAIAADTGPHPDAVSGSGSDPAGRPAGATSSALELKVVCDGASAPILTLDWDETSQLLQVNDESGELHFFRVETGERLEHPSEARDMRWIQQKCPMSAATRHAWRHPDFGVDCVSAHVSQDRDLLVMGESMGQVKLLRCPASHPDAKARAYAAHVGAVRQVSFNSDRSHVVSIGAKDGMVAVWRLVRGSTAPILTLPWSGEGVAPAKYGFEHLDSEIEEN